MRRSIVGLAVVVLAGCGFMQVGERPIPSVAGSVAATEWQSQDPELPGVPEDFAGATTPEDFLELLIQEAFAADQIAADGVRYGILGRTGDEATAYLQLTDPRLLSGPNLAYEAYLTLVADGDGTWTLGAVKVREQCSEPLTNGACGDNSGGGGAAPAQPTSPPT